jgi:hypothetical protein
MYKHSIKAVIVICLLTAFGCNKDSNCSHCTVKNSSGAIVKDYDEKCSTPEDVREYERSAAADAGQYGGNFECDRY